VVTAGRPLLFYSAWPLGYHNVEAERKAEALAAAGYDVVYVAGVGVRNPRPVTLPKLLDRVARRLRTRPSPAGVGAHGGPVRTAALLVAPPRQVAFVRRLNAAWVGRQLVRALPEWDRAVAWVRWPTPELVDVLARTRPAAVIYECVDAYHRLPEWTAPWLALHERAERQLVAVADVVVVPGEVLAERFREWGADVRVVPHGVELFDWSPPRPDRRRPTIAFIGTLDFRLDVTVLRCIAEARPEWRVRLIGPVQRGFRPSSVTDLTNVTVEPPVPHDRLGPVLARVDAVVLPYTEANLGRWLTPVKALEALAAGRPLVSPPLPSMAEHSAVVYFARSQDEFVSQLERALADDDEERARRRRAVAEANAWSTRLAELVGIVDEVLKDPRRGAGPAARSDPSAGAAGGE
jgi:UDP-galactopyranose mutase